MSSVVLPVSLEGRLRTRASRKAGAGILLAGNEVDKALDQIVNVSLPKIFGLPNDPNFWLRQFAPLTKDQIKRIIRALMYYYGLGYDPRDVKSFYLPLKKSLPDLAAWTTKVAEFMTGIDPARFPADYALLKTGRVNADLQQQQKEIANKEKREAIAYEIQDKINRGVSAVASTGLEAAKTVNAALPWYMRPTTILPLAGVAALAYFYLQKKGIKEVLRPIYKMNPIAKPRAKAKDVYKMFHAMDPKKTIALDAIDTKELVQLGNALEVGYRSKKWTGKAENYLHKFGKGVRLMCTADRKTLIIHGGNMEVQDVGIVN